MPVEIPEWLNVQRWKGAQTLLRLGGFYRGKVDGIPGGVTCDAVVDAMASISGEPAATPDEGFPPPGKFALSATSLQRMEGLHPDLMAVTHYALRISPIDFLVTPTGGVRTPELQRRLVDRGASRTMHSRHLTGHAIDVVAYVGGRADWGFEHCVTIHKAFVAAGDALGVKLRWGGDWDGDGDMTDQKFRDGYHHELPASAYGDGMDLQSRRAAEFLATLA